MEKDFYAWNIQKKNVNQSERKVLFREGEIWWCILGLNIGFEQDGANEFFERPVLILKKFSKDVLWILPITKSIKTNKYYFPIVCLEFPSSTILSQIRLISSKRLRKRIRPVSRADFFKIVERIKAILPLRI